MSCLIYASVPIDYRELHLFLSELSHQAILFQTRLNGGRVAVFLSNTRDDQTYQQTYLRRMHLIF